MNVHRPTPPPSDQLRLHLAVETNDRRAWDKQAPDYIHYILMKEALKIIIPLISLLERSLIHKTKSISFNRPFVVIV